MRRVVKKLLLLISGVLFTIFYCEILIYYVVVAQCSWPVLELHRNNTAEPLKALIFSDPHLLGPRKGHWLDKWRREWQMHRAFQSIITWHKPEAVFVLGDLFDEGEWSNDKQFSDYVERFYRLFAVPDEIVMHVVVGNHDIGFHYNIRRGSAARFSKLLNAPSVQLLTIKDNHFVLLNSMAMEGDSCTLCMEARKAMQKVSEILECAKNPSNCPARSMQLNYSRPIFMQHFPLYRVSDAMCTEPDAPPLPNRNKPFRLKIDALSKEATEFIVKKIKPRAVFGGHTHHGCLLHHSFESSENIQFIEYSVPSFSWRNRPDPKYMLVTITPQTFGVHKCGLPKETTMAITAVIMILLVNFYVFSMRSIGTTSLL